MMKDIFIVRDEQPDVVEDCKSFLRLIDELRLYTVEFEEHGTIKPKKYSSDFAMRGEEY